MDRLSNSFSGAPVSRSASAAELAKSVSVEAPDFTNCGETGSKQLIAKPTKKLTRVPFTVSMEFCNRRELVNQTGPSTPAGKHDVGGVMSAAYIAAALGDQRREGPGWRCRCPLHGGRSLVIRDGYDGRILLTCWGGCDRLDVLGELRRLGLLDRHAGRPDVHYWQGQDRRDVRNHGSGRIARARAVWDGTTPGVGSPVERYLRSRGITIPPPATLRWAPRCWHRDARQHLPAMIALVEHVEQGIVGIHRTYVRNDGSGKALLPKNWQRRSLGPVKGGAVRLESPRPGEWFAIGEGIETTLSVMAACAMPGWSALSEGGIRALILPAEATHVLICADHDANNIGQRAAHDAAERWLTEGRRVRVAIPPEPDTDFNDVLTAAGYAKAEVRHVA